MWLLAFLLTSLLLVSIFLGRSLYISQAANKRLYNSLSSEEKNILEQLAKAEFGQTEDEIYDLVSVPTQQFLWLIDQLVKKYQLVERTEPSSGGAFWSLSEKGRAFAAELKLYHVETVKTKSN